MKVELEYGEAAIALGFLKLIRGQLPNQQDVRPQALKLSIGFSAKP